MDISDTLAPNSDQLDAIELVSGPRTFTIEKVTKGNDEQPVQVHLVGFPRPWRPGKSMRRVLAAGWGADATVWPGRRVTLYCDTGVKFGGAAVGGTRISHMSHLPKPLSVPLLVTRGKSAIYTVQPLPDTPAPAPHVDVRERAASALDAFAKLGVDQAAVEQHIGKPLAEWTHDDLPTLFTMYREAKADAEASAPEPPTDDEADALWKEQDQ